MQRRAFIAAAAAALAAPRAALALPANSASLAAGAATWAIKTPEEIMADVKACVEHMRAQDACGYYWRHACDAGLRL